MALKRQYPPLATFSMSSMTDVIFLLLIFFMVTSTLIIPSAMEVELPESSEQTTLKPVSEVYIDSIGRMYIVMDRNDSTATNSTPRLVTSDRMAESLELIHATDSTRPVSLYAHKKVEYGTVVEVLDLASRKGIKMVLATQPAPAMAAESNDINQQ